MPDRTEDIRARLAAIGAWRLREEPEDVTQNVEATFRQWAPQDIAYLLAEVDHLCKYAQHALDCGYNLANGPADECTCGLERDAAR